MSSIQSLSDSELSVRFEKLVSFERKTTAEIVDCLGEIDRRKIYLSLGHTSLFAYLTNSLGYTPASAQRRINSARLMHDVPELKNDLQSGALNLTQISLVAQAIRQTKAEKDVEIGSEARRSLLQSVKEKDLNQTQQILNATLDIELKTPERKRIQKNESVRLEITLAKNQMAKLERVKELASHKMPSANCAELIEFLADFYLQRKDPLIEKHGRRITAETEAAPGHQLLS